MCVDTDNFHPMVHDLYDAGATQTQTHTCAILNEETVRCVRIIIKIITTLLRLILPLKYESETLCQKTNKRLFLFRGQYFIVTEKNWFSFEY